MAVGGAATLPKNSVQRNILFKFLQSVGADLILSLFDSFFFLFLVFWETGKMLGAVEEQFLTESDL